MTIDAEAVRRAAEAAARAFPDRPPTPVQEVPNAQDEPFEQNPAHRWIGGGWPGAQSSVLRLHSDPGKQSFIPRTFFSGALLDIDCQPSVAFLLVRFFFVDWAFVPHV